MFNSNHSPSLQRTLCLYKGLITVIRRQDRQPARDGQRPFVVCVILEQEVFFLPGRLSEFILTV